MNININKSRLFKPTTKRIADLDGPDFFPTPEWATFALIDNEDFTGPIWECACGDGAMSEVLKLTNENIHSTDLYNRGYGSPNINFLDQEKYFDNIITNPPYHSASAFVEHGLKLSRKKLALLLRLAFLEGKARYYDIFSKYPPSKIWIFSERITFYPKGAKLKGSGTTAYAWFIWDKTKPCKNTNISWLEPKYKKMQESILNMIGKA